MIFVTIFVMALTATAGIQAQKSTDVNLFDACAAQAKVSKEAIQQAMDMQDTSKADAAIKNYAHCLLSRSQILVNDVPQPQHMIKLFGPSCGDTTVQAIVDKCNKLKGRDNQETAYLLLHCYTNNGKGLKCIM